ncbi:hypothetical protein F441_03893 [Phytophthora nicotianae CJ01A1]|uniref:DUF5575 domain-containing protein n=1 Tax=Phytophthora nicotianae CJ01A1 TaxID=1317063 RepID=W2XK77_PHYNI|nr:hypothetical protein F441_03893 [Phytophthora nicotianae CJ01A1]
MMAMALMKRLGEKKKQGVCRKQMVMGKMMVNVQIVEPPVKYHASWEDWQSYFEDYCQRTLQVIPVKETMSRAERNKRLKKTKKGEDESQLVPEGFDPYQRTYICTHGWNKRKSRSEGSRPRQHIRLTNCPFTFVVQWYFARGELQVKNGHFAHNHPVSPAAFATYPASRGVMDPLVGVVSKEC